MSLQCYNRGCGQKYSEDSNDEECCRHHPGVPIFHDAYKGWSCCNKKCIDFTEFLNIKGCTVSKHCNEKQPEPEKKPTLDTNEVKPIIVTRLTRPSFDTELVLLKPVVAAASISPDIEKNDVQPTNEIQRIQVGTTCKNSGCGVMFDSQTSECIYHSGVPIFHEGLKFWSCCRKRTTDFAAFLSQLGCEQGTHVWIKEQELSNQIECKWDHYQTSSHVIVSIYARQYCPKRTTVELNPVRLKANVVFPHRNYAIFSFDSELNGVIIVDSSSVQMFGSKIEIKMRKAEAGSWSRFDVPVTDQPSNDLAVDIITPKVEGVDLGGL